MDLTIRLCCLDDVDSIYELNRTQMGYEYPLDDTRENLARLLADDRHRIFVAVIDNAVVGYVHANDYDLLYAPPMKNIMGIAVAEPFKRMGAGTALLTAVEQWARESGAAGVRLVSGAGRTGAHEFYRSLGYLGGNRQLNFKKFF